MAISLSNSHIQDSFKNNSVALSSQTEKSPLSPSKVSSQTVDHLRINQAVDPILKSPLLSESNPKTPPKGKENRPPKSPEASEKMRVSIKRGLVLFPAAPQALPNLFPKLVITTSPSKFSFPDRWTWKQVITNCSQRFSRKIEDAEESAPNAVREDKKVMKFPNFGSFSFSKPPSSDSPTKAKEAASVLSSFRRPLSSDSPSKEKEQEAALTLSSNFDPPLPEQAVRRNPSSSGLGQTSHLYQRGGRTLSFQEDDFQFAKPLPRAPKLKALLALSSTDESSLAALTPETEWTHLMDEKHVPKSARVHFSTLLKAYFAGGHAKDSLTFRKALSESQIIEKKGLEFLDLFEALPDKRRSQIEEFLNSTP